MSKNICLFDFRHVLSPSRTDPFRLEEKSLHTKAFLWSKTSLNTGGVGGTREAIPTCKMVAFLYVLDTN